jgi:DNA-binding SARP family transcriptional activator/tetratricopeptide (TPR) repeat protein
MDVAITLLGGFRVSVGGVDVADDAWGRRSAAGLVKLLALAPERRLHREQVIDALWPEVGVAEAGPRLHKAAHFARRSLGEQTSGVALRGDVVLLLPDDHVDVDAARFESEARSALEGGDADSAAAVLDTYCGDLLPDDLYEPWAEEARERLRMLRADLLRRAGRWEVLLQDDPMDEEAHVALARRMALAGDVRGGLRQLERLDRALRAELGTVPGPEAVRLRASLQAALGHDAGTVGGSGRALVGRERALTAIDRAMVRARAGHGTTVLVTGPTGVGKSAVLAAAARRAQDQDWRIGRGAASSVEGAWAYSAVLEALADLCRHHPTILDGLDDAYRTEIDRALSGRALPWSGESAHQRLFIAAAELVRLAAAGHGLLLVIEDLHEADEASLRLIHYLARCAVAAPVMLLLTARAGAGSPIPPALASLLARGVGERLELAPLTLDQAMDLLAERHPDLRRSAAERLWTISGGLPFTLLESARAAGPTGPGGADAMGGPGGIALASAVSTLPPTAGMLVRRLAVLGMDVSTDEVLALADGDAEHAFADLEAAVDALVLVPGETGYRFRHEAVRDAVLAATPPHRRPALHRAVAHRLDAISAPPARVARHLISGGDRQAAVPYVLRAVGTLGALGAYRDALDLIDAVLDHATGEGRGDLLARRGDLLMALGSPDAMAAYRAAIPLTSGVENRLARARLSRAACFAGDFDTASAAIDGLELEGDAADGPLLVARGNLAYFTGDTEAAWEAASRARRDLSGANDPWQYVDLVSLQGLIAHDRGEWFDRLRLEMRQTLREPDLAVALFDAHLCVAEYVLYGPVPFPEVIEMARSLRDRAERFGALRGVAFATSLLGEAALLMGDLDLAEEELERSVGLHREVAAPAGEANSLQRLAEVRLLQGDRSEAQRLLQRALPLARWSLIGMHLLQRIYGSMIAAAPDPVAARAVVDRAEATMGETDRCAFCDLMFAVPASIACADVGDLDEARRRLAQAEALATRWNVGAWTAAVTEARAHLVVAQGDPLEGERLFQSAAELFEAAGQPLDARRCRQALLTPVR